MRFSPFLCIFFLAVLFHQSFLLASASVEETCKAAAATNLGAKFDLCVTTLESYPNTGSADTRTLAILAAGKSMGNAVTIRFKIDDMLNIPTDPATKSCLDQCKILFDSNIIPTLASSTDAIQAGNNGEAKAKLNGVRDKPFDCDRAFLSAGKQPPFAQEDEELADLSTIALAITTLLG